LDREIASKKQMLEQVREKQKVLQETNQELDSIVSRIDTNSANARSSLRRGMTKAEVRAVLGEGNISDGGDYDRCYITGNYFLIFQGEVLMKVVENGSHPMNNQYITIDNCSDARISVEIVVR